MGEIEIDLRNLLLQICMQWRKFVVFMIVGAVLLGGFAGIRSYLETSEMKKNAQMSSEEYEQLQMEKLAKANSKLEEREIVEVRSAFQTYQDAIYTYDAAMEYQANSVKMHLNPNAVPTLNISYYIDNHYEMSYPIINKANNINAICSAISDVIEGEETCRIISEKLGWNKENQYISELISSWSADGILHVTILASEQEDCEEMRDVISDMLESQLGDLRETFGDFDVVFLEERFDICVNNALQTEQTNQTAYMDSAKNIYKNAGSSLSSTQKKSFDALVELFEIRDKYFVEQIDNVDELTEMPQADYFQPKYIVMGMFLGIIILGAWIFVKYLLSIKLHVADDLTNVYGIDVLAVVDVKANTLGFAKNGKRKWFKFVDDLILWSFGYKQILSEERASNLASAEILIATKKLRLKRVYIISTICTKRCREIQKSICALLEKDLEVVFNEEMILENPKELERMMEYDGIVFVEECDETVYKEVKQVVACCRRNNVAIIGGVVIEG